MHKFVALLAIAAAASSQVPQQARTRKVVCACVASSCHFDKPLAGGLIYAPEKISGESLDLACLPEGTRAGLVILSVRIDERGRVTDACVLRGMGAAVDKKAVAQVMTWRYEPAALARPQAGKAAGSPVPIAITVAVEIKVPANRTPGLDLEGHRIELWQPKES